jgi:hypothetical protein
LSIDIFSGGKGMKESKMHMVAGVLDVVESVLKLFAAFGLIIAVFAVGNNPMLNSAFGGAGVFVDIPTLLLIIAIPFAILGVLGMVGGIYALLGKRWALALAGSIAAALPFSVLGIAAFIITVLTRDEFSD